MNLLAETIALNNLPLEKTLTPDALSPVHSDGYERNNSFVLNNQRSADDIFKYLDKSQYNINKPIGFGCGVGIISLESEIIHSLRHIMKVFFFLLLLLYLFIESRMEICLTSTLTTIYYIFW